MSDTDRSGIGIDPGFYLAVLSSAITQHLADLRVALRSFEDGSFRGKAATGAGKVLNFAIEPEGLAAHAPTRLCNRCFVSIVGEMVTYLDRMIALQNAIAGPPMPPDARSKDDLLRQVATRLDDEYRAVASDTSLTNPKKLDRFSTIDVSLAREPALSYFQLRRAIEHHGSRPLRSIVLRFARLKLLAGSDEITEMGRPLPENTGISLGMQVESREFIAGQPIKLRETELEHISFTIQHLIAPEIRRVLVERPTGS